ncbi:hypothetical protein EDF62_2923 [Leucobacter luti]|uniref:FAR-17a/AIG1-like protein n=1 Tax=Leucobacter luti TaxID=340320 RepID=A0A4R6RTW5_9MICO|nr:Pr6Pr family membrane protein [Leucobacter luti]TDP90353.1 hypothetical protein EDF62_2923 [Leucobacter luti]
MVPPELALHLVRTPHTQNTRSFQIIGVLRIAGGVGALAVLGIVYALNIAGGDANPLNTFGYFTNLTTLLASAVTLASGTVALRNACPPTWLTLARGASASSLLIVAVVYNGLVPGTGSAPPWASFMLHLVFPALTLLDWFFIGDRPRLPWRTLGWALPYPLLWLAVTLIRGLTDGWVPYGFLLPERGPLAIALTSAGLCGALLLASALTWGATRFRGVVAPNESRTQQFPI